MSWPSPTPHPLLPPEVQGQIRRVRALRGVLALAAAASGYLLLSRYGMTSATFIPVLVIAMGVGQLLNRRERQLRGKPRRSR